MNSNFSHFKDMKKLLYLVFFFLLMAFAWHKYYVSVTEINVKNDHLEIIIRTFPDDIENVLSDTYGIKADLSKKQTKSLLKTYIQSHFILWTDHDRQLSYKYLGFTLEDGFLVLLLKADLPPDIHILKVKNTLLFDMYDEQKNVVHFIEGKKKESYILVKEEPVATFHLSK